MQRKSLVVLIVLFVLVVAAVWGVKEMETRRLERTLAARDLDLRLANLHRLLGVASHEAQRNNYANAADAARQFFDGCRSTIHEYDFHDMPRTRLALSSYGSQGDVILGKLANGEPDVKERLAELYLTMDGVLARRQ